jgi:UDP-N-acetylmuramoylalanine--D-glutamate ligase
MILAGRNVLVVGMARSGLAAAAFLSKRGAKVKVSDKRPERELQTEVESLRRLGIDYETGGHVGDSFLSADLVVVSPGVPLRLSLLLEASRTGKEVISEIELASRFLRGRVVGITGSNGKTTTTTLIGALLKAAGFRVQVGGNIGTALTSLVEYSTPETITVVELSSFQLEAIPTFRPDVAVLLNITPDHMDRYDSFEDYTRAKMNILKNQRASDFAVLNHDDKILRDSKELVHSKAFWFSTKDRVAQGTYLEAEQLVFSSGSQREGVVPLNAIQLRGRHNLENVAGAITVARLFDIPSAKISGALKQFKGVEHRLEWVAEIQGVQFYNDSKATNTDATIKALEAFPSSIILILGGRDKGSDFTVLEALIQERVKTLILLGEAAEKIKRQLKTKVPQLDATSLEQATQLAFERASIGDVVLLAPACASFDMFRNYEHRGEVFKEAVRQLQEKTKL